MLRPKFSIVAMLALTAVVAVAVLQYRHEVQLQQLTNELETRQAFQEVLLRQLATTRARQALLDDLSKDIQAWENTIQVDSGSLSYERRVALAQLRNTQLLLSRDQSKLEQLIADGKN